MRPWTTARSAATVLVTMVVAGLSVACGAPAHAIADGQDAAEGRYPFAAKLAMTGIPSPGGGRRNSSCSGALVAPRWVITAGHCFRNLKGAHVSRPVARLTTVTVGRTDLTGKAGHQAKVIAVRQSPTADVALVKLDKPITDIAPVRLSRKPPRVGAIVRLAGYGLTVDDDESTLVTRLQTGQFKVVSLGRSSVGMAGHAPRRTTSACSRDSGGPYFTQPGGGETVLVAVVSHGPSCPHAKVDQSGRIDTIAGWITGIVGKPAATPTSKPTKRPTAPGTTSRAPRPEPVGATPPGIGSPASRTAVAALVLVGFGTPVALLMGARRRRAHERNGVRRHRR